jgi:hypothetical protein
MRPLKSVFYGFGAFVGRIDGESRCAFWPQDPEEVNYDAALLVPIDLDANVAAARAGKIAWSDVKVDEHYLDGGTTSIGPYFPDGEAVGAVYLEKTYWDRLRREIRPELPAADYGARDYEFQTVVYWEGTGDPRAGKRYFGFHAEVLDVEESRACVAIYDAGSSRVEAPRAKEWLDLDSLAVDAPRTRGGLTDIGVGGDLPLAGALFIEAERAALLGAEIPKLPPSAGGRPILRPWARPIAQPPRARSCRPIRLPGR